MSAMPIRVGLLVVGSLFACGAPAPAGPVHDPVAAAGATADALRAVAVGEVRAELECYYADFSARDWTAFAAHFWAGATITTRWQPPGEGAPRVVVTSVPDFVAQAPQGPGSKPIFEERMTGSDTRIQDDLAQVWARYDARFGEPGDVKEWSGVDSFTLMKHDGAWKIVALAFTNED